MNVCSAPGTMSSSKSLSAAMSRSASRSVWSGWTWSSISPWMSSSFARQPVRDIHVGGTGPGLGVVRAVVGLYEAQVEVAGVVRAGEGDADLVHLGEVQHRPRCGEPASRVAERAHPVQSIHG